MRKAAEQAVKQALFTMGYKAPANGRRGQREEWRCSECSYSNWAARQVCRQCGKPWASTAAGAPPRQTQRKGGQGKGKGSGRPDHRPVVGGAPVAGSERQPQVQDQAATLEQLAAAAKRAGAQSAVMLAQEAKSAREAAVAAKPLHVRLGRVKQRLEQAEHKETEAQQAAEQAQARWAQASAHTETVRKELAEVEAEVTADRGPAAAPATKSHLVPAVRQLLGLLEQGRSCEGCDTVAEVVADLHRMVEAVDPTPAGQLDVALPDGFYEGVTTTKHGVKRPGEQVDDAERDREVPCAEDAVALARELQHKLWGDELTDAAFGAVARAALNRRMSPF